MSRIVTRWLAFALVLLASWSLHAQEIQLTPTERAWLRDHPVITVATFAEGFPPFEVIVNGRVEGVGPSYLAELTRGLGIRAHYRIYPTWQAVTEAARVGEVDLVMNLSPTPDRAEYLVFGRPYFEHLPVLITRQDNPQLNDASGIVAGTTLASLAGDATAELAQRQFHGVRMIYADSMQDVMRLVADGRADACIEDPYVARTAILAAGLQRQLRVGAPVSLPMATLGFAAPRDRAPLISALDKAQAKLTAEDHARLRMPWLDVDAPLSSDDVSIPLNEAERTWLSRLPPLRVAFDATSPPYTLLDRNGQPAGIANDYLREVARTLHLRLTYVPAQSWADAKQLMRDGKVDVLPVASPYSEEAALMSFSMAYLDYPVMIVTRMDESRITNVLDLRGKRVTANTSKYSVRTVIERLADSTVIPVTTTEQGLAQVADGKADAFVGDLANADFLIREHFPGRLKISAPTDDYVVLAMGVSRNYASLVPLINRVLMNIPERRHQAIRNTWLASRYTYGGSWKEITRKTLPVTAVVLLFLLTISYAYFRLRRETRQRQRTEEQLTDITRSLPVVVYKFRYSRDQGVRFLFVSGNPEPIFGITADTFFRDEPRAFSTIIEEDREPLLAEVDRSARTLTPMQADIRVLVDHAVRWVSTNAMPRREGDHVVFNGYWVDVTDQRLQADQLARAKEQAEAATQAKTEFLVTMSHEIRTPMSGVIGMLELLSHTTLSQEQRQMLGTVETSATALLQILDDVLDFSKIEAGRLTIEYVPVDVRDLVDSTVSILSAPAHRKGLSLGIRIDSRLAAEVSAENVRLRQVLLNLLSNAIKFTMLGSVRVDVTVLEDDGDHQRVRFSVIDTGIGMSSDQVERLFAPFTQAESSTTRRFGGTGLGLYICRRLVQLMGGEIVLESMKDRGTSAHVELWMPIYHRRPPQDVLQGLNARIALDDAGVADAVRENVLALGMRVVDDVRADLAFMDETGTSSRLDGEVSIHVARAPDPLGYTVTPHGVTITGNPVKWSTFAIACRLALGVGASAPDASLVRPLVRMQGRRVLVAEDSPINQTLIAAQLEKLGHACDVVGNGVEALRALESSDYAMLITDCHMPVMDGYELARSIRRHEAGTGKHLHIIAMTANAMAGELERCTDAGMDDFVSKPVRMVELRHLMEKILDVPEEKPVPETPYDDMDVDISMLRECFGDDHVIRSLIDRFVSTTRTDLQTLDGLVAERRCADVAHWLHRLLGGLQVFGTTVLTEVGSELEHAMKTEARYDRLADVADFRVRVAAYMDGLEAMAQELAGA